MRARRSLAASAHALSDSTQLATLCALLHARTRDETRSTTERGSHLHARKPHQAEFLLLELSSCYLRPSLRCSDRVPAARSDAPVVPAASV